MSERDLTPGDHGDSAPGDDEHGDPIAGIRAYVVGLVLAALLTVGSFWVAGGFVARRDIAVRLVAARNGLAHRATPTR